jgi:hypothetical protein
MDAVLASPLRRSANWFYWIAGLSLINAFAIKSNFEFMFGSGAVQVAPAFGQTAAIVTDVIVVGGFAVFGYLATHRHTWALAIGMLLYLADGALYVFGGDYLPALFHAYVLYVLFGGLQASIALNRLPAETRTMVMPHVASEPAIAPESAPPEA